jgi:dTDP-4-amino-4,6-dideoxygalactose transaminase
MWQGLALPITERLAKHELSLPISQCMTKDEVSFFVEKLNAFLPDSGN